MASWQASFQYISISMSKKIHLIGLAALTLVAFGCSTETPQATAQEKKAFMGGPMPKGFMEKNAAAMAGPKGAGPGAAGAPAGK